MTKIKQHTILKHKIVLIIYLMALIHITFILFFYFRTSSKNYYSSTIKVLHLTVNNK